MNTKIVDCPICSNKSNKYLTSPDFIYGIKGKWDVYKCTNNNCLHIFQYPIPNEKQLNSYYSKNYYAAQPPQIDFKPSFKKNRGVWLKIIYLKYYLNYNHLNIFSFYPAALLTKYFLRKPFDYDTPKFLKHGKILDYGSGSGDTVSFLKFLGWDSVGIDFSKEAVQAGQDKNLNIIHGSIKELENADNHYDHIISSHCVEHVPDVYRLFNAFYNSLKKGGSLSIEVPNGNSLSFKILKKYYVYLTLPLHIHIFSIKSLSYVAEKIGFKNIKFSTFNNLKKQATSFEFINRNKKNGLFLGSKEKIKLRYYLMALLKTYTYKGKKKGLGDCIVMKMTK